MASFTWRKNGSVKNWHLQWTVRYTQMSWWWLMGPPPAAERCVYGWLHLSVSLSSILTIRIMVTDIYGRYSDKPGNKNINSCREWSQDNAFVCFFLSGYCLNDIDWAWKQLENWKTGDLAFVYYSSVSSSNIKRAKSYIL